MQIAYHGMHDAVVVPVLRNQTVTNGVAVECTAEQARGLLIQTETWLPADAEAAALLAELLAPEEDEAAAEEPAPEPTPDAAPVNEESNDGDR